MSFSVVKARANIVYNLGKASLAFVPPSITIPHEIMPSSPAFVDFREQYAMPSLM